MAEASGRSTLPPQGKDTLAREALLERFQSTLQLTREQAIRLEQAGFVEVGDVRNASDERLREMDLSTEEIKRIKEGGDGAPSPESSDALLEKWLQDRQKSGAAARAKPGARRPKALGAVGEAPSSDLLKRWVAGDGNLMDDFMRQGAAAAPPAAEVPSTSSVPPTSPAAPAPPPASAPGASAPPLGAVLSGASPSAAAASAPSSVTPASPALSAAPAGPSASAPSPAGAPSAAAPAAPAAPPEAAPAPETGGKPARAPGGRAPGRPSAPAAPGGAGGAVAPTGASEADLRAREETVLHWLTQLLDRVKSDNFDPAQLLREAQDLTRQLHEERGRRRELEEELEHVKKGSVAVIKYVRNREARAREEAIAAKEAEILELRRQVESARASGSSADSQRVLAERDERIKGLEEALEQAKTLAGTSAGAKHELTIRFQSELESKERESSEREGELKRKIIKLEEEVQKQRTDREMAERHAQLTKMDQKNLTSELKTKLDAVESREKKLSDTESTYKAKLDELMVRAEEFEKKKAPLQYKEGELIKWEEELRLKEQTLTAQLREMENAKKEQLNPENVKKLKRLEDLEAEVQKREEEIRTRESFINQKLEALERKERDVTDAEIERSKEERAAEVQANKVKTGVSRLDDLLLGGIALGTNILINAPSHTGKDLLGRLMAAEGLKKGVPVLWIITDKATSTIREEMTVVLSSYAEMEKKGLVRYIDLYSMSLGITSSDPLVTLLNMEDKNILENLGKAVDEAAAKFREKNDYYRLVFETVSTVTAYLDDASSTIRFLQPFVGKRKLEKAVSYYLVDTGMHSESDLQVLEHMMDGSVNLKVEQLKTFLAVKGLSEVQSRGWIQYTFTKKVFDMKSFTLELIR